MLEIKFAALRDRLYIERMEEAAAEEEMIHDGTHPALTYLYKTLAGRREKLHEVASRRHQQTLEELVKAREAEKDAVWTWWTVSSSARASVSLLRLVAGSDVVQQGPSCVGALTR
jgi:deoxyxylulose-5-phosphate synthase